MYFYMQRNTKHCNRSRLSEHSRQIARLCPTALSTPSEAEFCGLFYNPKARSIVPTASVWAFVMSRNYDNPNFWVTSGVKTVMYIIWTTPRTCMSLVQGKMVRLTRRKQLRL